MHQLVDLMKQTATGMEYLHARDILHRDLKSNNIFLIPKETNNMQRHHHHRQNDNATTGINKFNAFVNEQEAEKWTVKIGDFGLATVKSTWTQTSTKTNQPTGSILWMAPEVITQKVSDPYTQKSDVYSYGVVLYERVTAKLPFEKKEQNMILFLVGSGRLKLNPEDARSDTPNEIKELIVTCSQFDRDKRLDFVAINEKLKDLRLVKLKSKLQRAQSVPNLSSMNMTGLNLYDEDMIYSMNPSTPKFITGYDIGNNNDDTNKNTSQLISNM
jgi:serine/threonine protein kinase